MKAMGDREALLPPGAPGDRYVGDLLFWQPSLYRVGALPEWSAHRHCRLRRAARLRVRLT